MRRIPLAALLLCLALPAHAADFTLLNEQTYATQKGAWDVKVLDINGDNNGTNEAGARVAAGVYFCRLTCAAGTKVERVVFVAR